MRIFGSIVLIAGIVLLFFSNYIAQQVEEGKAKIENAQQSVDTGNALFSLDPNTKAVGQVLTSPAQQQINEGKGQVKYYSQLAYNLHQYGQIAIGLGIALIVLGFILKRKR